mmetsp:Transcript_132299/g.423243  ORF Transcript_132299/g.423243 Transcript_132299/m.423243 type:complete len:258 (+) Transcript_132299:649-1422(+)
MHPPPPFFSLFPIGLTVAGCSQGTTCSSSTPSYQLLIVRLRGHCDSNSQYDDLHDHHFSHLDTHIINDHGFRDSDYYCSHDHKHPHDVRNFEDFHEHSHHDRNNDGIHHDRNIHDDIVDLDFVVYLFCDGHCHCDAHNEYDEFHDHHFSHLDTHIIHDHGFRDSDFYYSHDHKNLHDVRNLDDFDEYSHHDSNIDGIHHDSNIHEDIVDLDFVVYLFCDGHGHCPFHYEYDDLHDHHFSHLDTHIIHDNDFRDYSDY